MVDGADQAAAAALGSRKEVHGHYALNPLPSRKCLHVVAPSIAAESLVDVLLRHCHLDVGHWVGRRNDVDNVHMRFNIGHAFFKIVDGVFVLQFEVALVVVYSGDNEAVMSVARS